MLAGIMGIAGQVLGAVGKGGSGAGAAAAMDPTKMGDIDLNQGFYGDAKIVFGSEEKEKNKTLIIIAVIAGAAVLFLIRKK